jgi:maltose alpha-D-glucosyltransferase / alpha-amylase
MTETRQALDDQLHWYKDAIIYELHIKAFCDSNGDGIGDFEGLLTKLDYLQELGVTAIWVLPFYPSPQKDDGYDIADYYTINPAYGTIEHFKRFLEEAHKRNLKVITELVVNHTSDQHPWFQRARKAPKGSPERDYYVWTDDPTQYKDVRIIFQDYEASNWTWDPVAQQYYWHRFFHHQPDLNYDHPQVQQEIFNVLDYWCQMGVDGFRLDAIPYLFEREGTNGENLPETHAFLKKLRRFVDEKYPGTVFLAEANMWPEDSASYFGDGDECHMNYHFPVMPRMFMAVQREDRYPITDIFDQTPEIPETCQWAMFLRNHDELTLEMVTDEERDYMYRVYAKDPKAKINLGIRHRLAPLMDNDRRKIELMNSLLFSMKGTPVIYYGDEIGMGDNFYLGDRNGVRTPMQWSPDRNAGFSAANPHSLYLPVIVDPEYHYEAVNVELQRRNTSSLFWFMKRLVNMRKRYKAFGRGDMQFLQVNNPKMMAFTRSYEGETILVLVNLSKHAQAASIDLKNFGGYIPIEVFSQNAFPGIKNGEPYFFTLGPHSFLWFVLEQQEAASHISYQDQINLPEFARLMQDQNKEKLQELLPHYFSKMKWFAGRNSAVHSTHITEQITIESKQQNFFLNLIEVQFESGLPQTYFLPLGFAQGEHAEQLRTYHPQALIAPLQAGNTSGYLCDANYLSTYQQWLAVCLLQSNEAKEKNTLQFNLEHDQPSGDAMHVQFHADSPGHCSLNIDDRIYLKLYRRVEPQLQPDVETARFLSRQGFQGTPAYLGSIDWKANNGRLYTIGMAQPLLENHGNGESFMLERVNNFIERILAGNHPDLLNGIDSHHLVQPLSWAEMPAELQTFIGGNVAQFCQELGQQLAQLHKALAQQGEGNAFGREAFSLHYQRSLFSGMQSLVRETFDGISARQKDLPPHLQAIAPALLQKRNDLLQFLKRIYDHKLEADKIRIHGHLGLGQVLLTGKGMMIHDFGGRAVSDFSERRLRRSPLRDAVTLIRSIYAVTYKGFLQNRQVEEAKLEDLMPVGARWAKVISGFFLHAYFEHAAGSRFFPDNEQDRQVLLETLLVRGALYDVQDGWTQDEKAFTGFHLLEALMDPAPVAAT